RDSISTDLSDVAYEVEIVSFEGSCDVDDDEVEVSLNIDFRLTSGPAAQAGPAVFHYFVAIPQFFPRPEGKEVFEVRRQLSGGVTAPINLTESNISITIPLEQNQPAAAFDVYLGLQLSDEQLDFNRQRLQLR
ncbi:MAG: hypothetical protein RLN70_03825, partial [Rhodospirillaceae bacterium]